MTTPAELAASLRQRNVKRKKPVLVSSSANDDDNYQDKGVEQSGDSDGTAITTLNTLFDPANIRDRDKEHTQAWSQEDNSGKQAQERDCATEA